MNTPEFVGLFVAYYPQKSRGMQAPKMQEVWGDIIRGIPDEVVALGLKRMARAERYPPTPNEFERNLWPLMDAWADRHPQHVMANEWFRRMRALRESREITYKEHGERECGGCNAIIRLGYLEEHDPFPDDGGLVYRELDGEWYVARCPLCSGPGAYRPKRDGLLGSPNALPVPDPGAWESGLWVPLHETPGGPLFDALLQEVKPGGRGLASLLKPKSFDALPRWTAWLKGCRERTRAKVLELAQERALAAQEAEDSGAPHEGEHPHGAEHHTGAALGSREGVDPQENRADYRLPARSPAPDSYPEDDPDSDSDSASRPFGFGPGERPPF